MESLDYVIIGGGVVGTSILNLLTRLGGKVCLIEKQSDVGMGASKANSGIIHTGLDCKTGTLKAKLNIKGFEMYPKIFDRLGVEYINNGHLVIGNDLNKIKLYLYPNIPSKVPDDNSDLILKVIKRIKTGFAVNKFYDLYPELKNEFIKFLKKDV